MLIDQRREQVILYQFQLKSWSFLLPPQILRNFWVLFCRRLWKLIPFCTSGKCSPGELHHHVCQTMESARRYASGCWYWDSIGAAFLGDRELGQKLKYTKFGFHPRKWVVGSSCMQRIECTVVLNRAMTCTYGTAMVLLGHRLGRSFVWAVIWYCHSQLCIRYCGLRV